MHHPNAPRVLKRICGASAVATGRLQIYPPVEAILSSLPLRLGHLTWPGPPPMLATSVRAKVAQLMVVFTLIVTIGGHWAILQSAAWVGMAVSYAHDAPLADALSKTFDGRHPCRICEAVRAGKNSEQKQNSLKVNGKLEWSLAPAMAWVFPREFRPLFQTGDARAPAREFVPPTPPPRAA